MRVAVASCLLNAVILVGCADQSGVGETDDVAAVSSALTIIDCQTRAAECLGVLPSADEVTTCRDEARACLGDVVDEASEGLSALRECRGAALQCATGAASFGEAAMCRADFEACVGEQLDLPGLPLPDLRLPVFPRPNGQVDPTNLLEGARNCRGEAQTCVDAASGDVAAIATCADGFTTCFGNLLTGSATDDSAMPPSASDDDAGVEDDLDEDSADDMHDPMDEAETDEASQDDGHPDAAMSDAPTQGGKPATDDDDAPSCAAQALSCLDDASGNPLKVAGCSNSFRTCLLANPPGLVGLPGRLGGSLPTPPTLSCLSGMAECLAGGGTPLSCIAQGQVCSDD